MPRTPDGNDLVDMLRGIAIALLRSNEPDLTARQLGVVLTCYLDTSPQTVRGLAEQLDVPKSSITRALDRLSALKLVRRIPDPGDRRSVLAQRTAQGAAYLRHIREIAAKMSART